MSQKLRFCWVSWSAGELVQGGLQEDMLGHGHLVVLEVMPMGESWVFFLRVEVFIQVPLCAYFRPRAHHELSNTPVLAGDRRTGEDRGPGCV